MMTILLSRRSDVLLRGALFVITSAYLSLRCNAMESNAAIQPQNSPTSLPHSSSSGGLRAFVAPPSLALSRSGSSASLPVSMSRAASRLAMTDIGTRDEEPNLTGVPRNFFFESSPVQSAGRIPLDSELEFTGGDLESALYAAQMKAMFKDAMFQDESPPEGNSFPSIIPGAPSYSDEQKNEQAVKAIIDSASGDLEQTEEAGIALAEIIKSSADGILGAVMKLVNKRDVTVFADPGVAWPALLNLRNLINQFLYLQGIYQHLILEKAIVNVHLWQMHMYVPSLSLIVGTVSMCRKIVEVWNQLVADRRPPNEFLPLNLVYKTTEDGKEKIDEKKQPNIAVARSMRQIRRVTMKADDALRVADDADVVVLSVADIAAKGTSDFQSLAIDTAVSTAVAGNLKREFTSSEEENVASTALLHGVKVVAEASQAISNPHLAIVTLKLAAAAADSITFAETMAKLRGEAYYNSQETEGCERGDGCSNEPNYYDAADDEEDNYF